MGCTFNTSTVPSLEASPVQVQSPKTVSRLKLKDGDVLICMQGQILPKSRAERAWGISPAHTPQLPCCAFPEKMPMCVWPLQSAVL